MTPTGFSCIKQFAVCPPGIHLSLPRRMPGGRCQKRLVSIRACLSVSNAMLMAAHAVSFSCELGGCTQPRASWDARRLLCTFTKPGGLPPLVSLPCFRQTFSHPPIIHRQAHPPSSFLSHTQQALQEGGARGRWMVPEGMRRCSHPSSG